MFMQNASSFRAAELVTAARHGLILSPDLGAAGVVAGSLVETEAGWRPIETLARGMRVSTYDGGFRAVQRVERQHVWPGAETSVIHVPAGALDNCTAFRLLAGQQVLLPSAVAEEVLDRDAALVTATALVGFRGIGRRRLFRPVEAIALRFDDDEVVHVNSGALVHCAAGGPSTAAAHFPALDGARAAAYLALVAEGALTTEQLCRAA